MTNKKRSFFLTIVNCVFNVFRRKIWLSDHISYFSPGSSFLFYLARFSRFVVLCYRLKSSGSSFIFSKKLIQLVIFKGVFWWLKSVMLRCLGLYERREAATTMRQGKGKILGMGYLHHSLAPLASCREKDLSIIYF